MSRPAALTAAFLACSAARVAALSVGFTKVGGDNPPFEFAGSVKDGDLDTDPFGYGNLNNASGSNIYVAKLSVGGKEYTVQLDTGSSDLWIDTTGMDLKGFTETGVETGLTYGCVYFTKLR